MLRAVCDPAVLTSLWLTGIQSVQFNLSLLGPRREPELLEGFLRALQERGALRVM
jgi:hypothetical protein